MTTSIQPQNTQVKPFTGNCGVPECDFDKKIVESGRIPSGGFCGACDSHLCKKHWDSHICVEITTNTHSSELAANIFGTRGTI